MTKPRPGKHDTYGKFLQRAAPRPLPEPRPCRCAYCLFVAKIERIQNKLPARESAVIEELLNLWVHEENEAAYYRAKGNYINDSLKR